ncbi:MAG: hypothetical protein ACPGVT_08315 [Maricaulaceae bacterium]
MDKKTLNNMREWAEAKMATGEEPPWIYYKLEQLAKLTEELANGMDATRVFLGADQMETPQERAGAAQGESGQVAEVVQIGIARSRRALQSPLYLPT